MSEALIRRSPIQYIYIHYMSKYISGNKKEHTHTYNTYNKKKGTHAYIPHTYIQHIQQKMIDVCMAVVMYIGIHDIHL